MYDQVKNLSAELYYKNYSAMLGNSSTFRGLPRAVVYKAFGFRSAVCFPISYKLFIYHFGGIAPSMAAITMIITGIIILKLAIIKTKEQCLMRITFILCSLNRK